MAPSNTAKWRNFGRGWENLWMRRGGGAEKFVGFEGSVNVNVTHFTGYSLHLFLLISTFIFYLWPWSPSLLDKKSLTLSLSLKPTQRSKQGNSLLHPLTSIHLWVAVKNKSPNFQRSPNSPSWFVYRRPRRPETRRCPTTGKTNTRFHTSSRTDFSPLFSPSPLSLWFPSQTVPLQFSSFLSFFYLRLLIALVLYLFQLFLSCCLSSSSKF